VLRLISVVGQPLAARVCAGASSTRPAPLKNAAETDAVASYALASFQHAMTNLH
jgi:hypothetical protein